MKRECILSRAISQPPMTLGGVEIHYSAVANEIIREVGCAGMSGDVITRNQTQYNGFCEAVMIMKAVSTSDHQTIKKVLDGDEKMRSRMVLDFILENADEIDGTIDEMVNRIEQCMAAKVESITPGKDRAHGQGL